jgi:hypothetical protein
MDNDINKQIEINWNNENLVSYYSDYKILDHLRKEYKITSEGIGTLKKMSKQNKILSGPFMLNRFDTAYLYSK